MKIFTIMGLILISVSIANAGDLKIGKTSYMKIENAKVRVNLAMSRETDDLKEKWKTSSGNITYRVKVSCFLTNISDAILIDNIETFRGVEYNTVLFGTLNLKCIDYSITD